jgi:protocatechuate 3,4-dioxygenase beta subunit
MRLLFILIVLLGASIPAAAFVGAGALEINVQDLNGKPVPQATVYAIYAERVGGRVPRFTADAEGRVGIRNLSPGTYEIHAFKESEGYPDTFFSFFINGNQKAWKVVDVYADRTTHVKLQLGPRYATLKLFVTDENGKPSGGGNDIRSVG